MILVEFNENITVYEALFDITLFYVPGTHSYCEGQIC